MATTDWPLALIPQTCQLTLRKTGLQFTSPFNGTTQALEFVAERWVLSVSLAQMAARNPRGVGSFCNRLAGGVERVRGWHFGHNRGVPMGTMRGVPTLSVGGVRGDTSLSITGALAGPNLLSSGGFEIDTNVDGLADGWVLYTNGVVTGGVQDGRPAGNASASSQRLYAANIGVAAADQFGIRHIANLPVIANTEYTVSVDVLGSASSMQCRLYIDWYTAGNALISSASIASTMPTSWQRRSLTAVTPATAAYGVLYLWMQASTSGIAVTVQFDNVQFERRGSATPYAGLASLRADDMLGAGGQLFQVQSDTLLNDAGAGSVPVVNRVRATISIGTAVVWSQPTAEFIMPAMQSGPVYRPGAIESAALDLVEVWG